MNQTNKKRIWIRQIVLDPLCIFTVAFAVWMLFFDDQNVFVQYRLYKIWQKLNQDRSYYTIQIQRIKKEKHELLHNDSLLEKFAREKYYMKREQETLYVIIEA